MSAMRATASFLLVSFVSLLALLACAGGCSPPSLLITPVFHANALQEIEVEPGQGWSPDKVAIIEVEGMLINARMDMPLQPGENKLSLFTQQLEQAEKDPKVKAVVLRINSPGGTVMASDTMYQQVRRFREATHKPVIASTQEVAASGAYYVACAADEIVAHPTSVVGSIGVIFQTFNVSGTMQKLGVSADAVKSGENKDMGSPFKNYLDERGVYQKEQRERERTIMQAMVDEYYRRFVSIVSTHRKLTDPQALKTATDGRVFTGEQALQLGLVDKLGLLSDAIAGAKEKAGTPKARVVMYKRPHGYSGSIYADTTTPSPQANVGSGVAVLQLSLPPQVTLPRGFYYLWQ